MTSSAGPSSSSASSSAPGIKVKLAASQSQSHRIRLPRPVLRDLGVGSGRAILLQLTNDEDGQSEDQGKPSSRGSKWIAGTAWPTREIEEASDSSSSTGRRSKREQLAPSLVDSIGSLPRCFQSESREPYSALAFAVPLPQIQSASRIDFDVESVTSLLDSSNSKYHAGTRRRPHLDATARSLLAIAAKELAIANVYVVSGQTLRLSMQSVEVTLRAVVDQSQAPTSFSEAQTSVYSVSRSTVVHVDAPKTQSEVADSSPTPLEVQSTSRLSSGKNPPEHRLGGLEKELIQLEELIKLPLMRPELFQQHGLQPPRGVLLHGPPGTGKTSLALSIAASFLEPSQIFTISGPELSSSYHGKTEARIRNVFKQARKQEQAVIIMDEIDVIAASREGDSSDAVGSRVVATLLTEIDGVGQIYRGSKKKQRAEDSRRRVNGAGADTDSENDEDESDDAGPHGAKGGQRPAGRIVVIAATNRPNVLDPALRRPGRLDREIEIGVPEPGARLDILKTLLRDVPHDLNEEALASVASRTHGFVGADLSALVRESGMRVIRRRLANEREQSQGSDAAEDNSLAERTAGMSLDAITSPQHLLHLDDLLVCLPQLRPSSLRSMLPPPPLSWSSIGLGSPESPYNKVRLAIQQTVEWPLLHGERMRKLGITGSRGVLLYGPPGCSKTMIARACAQSVQGINWIGVKGPELYSKYLGDTEKAIRDLFRKARSASPTILFFDEIDALTTSRSLSGGGDGSNAVSDRVIATLLTELDSFDPLDKVIVVAATNRPMIIDPALLRPGRIETLLYVGLPDHSARLDILRLRIGQMATRKDASDAAAAVGVDLDRIATLCAGCSGAEVVALCRDAGLRAMSEDVSGAEFVEQRHFEDAAREMKRGVGLDVVARLEQWRTSRGGDRS